MTASDPSLPDAAPAGSVSPESGLWLWRGAVPPAAEALASPPPDTAGARSRIEQIAHRLGTSAARVQWLALPGGLAVVGLAALAMVHLLTSVKPSMLGNGPDVVPSAVAMASPAAAPSAVPQPPPPFPAGQPEAAPALPAAQEAPPAPLAPPTLGPAERQTAKSRPSHRVHHAVRRLRAAHARRWAWEACRYQCDWGQPMSWHGGGY